jgi:uncharacterized protein YbaP (TraB family)
MDKRMRTGRARIAAAAAVAALAACAPQQSPTTPAASSPAMWKLADADTTIYLFGTFHLLPEGQRWRTPAIEAAMASSDELVMEIGDIGDPMATAQAMMRLGMSPGLPPLAERVPQGKRDELRTMIAESGIPAAVLDRMETWAAGLSLAAVMFKRLGLSADAGVERGLTQGYKTAGKPIRGLETVQEQFGFFDGLSEEGQRAFLVGLLEDPAGTQKQFAAMLKAWSSGDVDAIAETFNDDVMLSAELRERLLARRNARWAEWVAERMEQPGTVFVAVGAGHLAGDESVQTMLRSKGLKAKRVQ